MDYFQRKPAPTKYASASNNTANGTGFVPGNQSPLHGALIQALMAAWSHQKGIKTVAASLLGYQEPIKQGRHEPDLFGRDAAGYAHLGEAKTGNGDLNTDHSKEQFRDFSSRTERGRVVPFHIIVPKHAELELRQVLQSCGLLGKSNILIWTR